MILGLIFVVPSVQVWSHEMRSVALRDDGDLTITWTARAFSTEIRYRLYSYGQRGEMILLTEETARAGRQGYRFIDDRDRLGSLVAYRLVAVLPDGEERVLATAMCIDPQLDGTAPGLAATWRTEAATADDTDVVAVSPGEIVLRPADAGAAGTRPSPEVPPPRA